MSLQKAVTLFDTYFRGLEATQQSSGSWKPNSTILGFKFGPAQVMLESSPPSIYSYGATIEHTELPATNADVSGTIEISIKVTPLQPVLE